MVLEIGSQVFKIFVYLIFFSAAFILRKILTGTPRNKTAVPNIQFKIVGTTAQIVTNSAQTIGVKLLKGTW